MATPKKQKGRIYHNFPHRTFYVRKINNPDEVFFAAIIPKLDSTKKPFWIKHCALKYSEDLKTATTSGSGMYGKVGHDIVVWYGKLSAGDYYNDLQRLAAQTLPTTKHNALLTDVERRKYSADILFADNGLACYGLEHCTEFGTPIKDKEICK